jgi:putative holliday junction resolvase
MPTHSKTILALDVGDRRIGVAVADAEAGFAHPLTTLTNSDSVMQELQQLIERHATTTIVIGLPRGLEGQETAQTASVRAFAKILATHVSAPLEFQDEALTSQKAESELRSRSKPFTKGEVDALAATYILEDYITEHPVRNIHV